METLKDRENKVINFMDEVEKQREEKQQEDAFKNSVDYKIHCLNKGQEDAKGICLDAIFSKIYKNALPLNDDYKVAHGEDLDAEIHDFIHDRCPKGLEYYVKEANRKGSKICGKILEAVDDIVDKAYADRAFNVEDYNADDMVFKMDDDTQQKIDVMAQDLSIDDITNVIHDNVKATAAAEITRAKDEKEKVKSLENELANDMSMTSEAAINDILSLKGYNQTATFEPSLFQGIMIGKYNQIQKMYEAGLNEEYLYDTLSDYGYQSCLLTEGVQYATPEELAFVESVKELTKLNMIKSLKLEKFSLDKIRDMAQNYAEM